MVAETMARSSLSWEQISWAQLLIFRQSVEREGKKGEGKLEGETYAKINPLNPPPHPLNT